MYSRNRSVSADERYAKNLPPVYGGSRFYRGAGTEGIAVQYEAKPREIELAVPASPQVPADDAELPTCLAQENDTCEEPLCLTDADEPPPKPCEKHEKTGGFLQSLLSGEQEELLLITLLLLLSGEQDRCVDVIVILVLLLIVR